MTLLERSTSRTGRGVVGDRQLVAIQTVDVTRLPIHPVPIVPSTFVAVSGWGPGQGSNESGKTSFQASVALLCGDPEWWTSSGGTWATSLLFVPDVAGDGTGAVDAARWGYVIGVFGDPTLPSVDHLTVWLKISAESPHLTARWAPGVHFAENRETADDTWRGLPARNEVRNRSYVEAMFGGSHRCLAWVAKRGDQPARASLLSITVDKFTPSQIGHDLLAVIGRADLLDREKEQRRATAAAEEQAEARRAAEDHQQLEDQRQLEDVERRNRAREYLERGQQMWQLHFAKGLVDIRQDVATAILQRRAARRDAADAERQHREALERVADLGDGTQLDAEVEKAEGDAQAAEARHNGALTRRAGLAAQRDGLTKRARELTVLASRWDHTPVDDLEATLADARAEVSRLQQDLGAAQLRHDQARDALNQLTSTGSPAAAALADEDITAAVLADAVVVTDRERWEALLEPWKEAVVVTDDDIDRALAVLGNRPGTILIHGPRVSTESLPSGIADAPAMAVPFLRALDASWASIQDPTRVTTDLVTILGGWPDEQLGNDARRAIAERDLLAAQDLVAQAEQRLETANYGVDLVMDRLEAARAHAARQEALADLAKLDEPFAEAERQVSDAADAMQTARDALVNARTVQTTFQDRLQAAQQAAEQCGQSVKLTRNVQHRHDEDIKALRDRMQNYWHAGWGRPWRDAHRAVHETRHHEVSSLRKDASEALLGALQALRIEITTGAGAPTDAVRSVVDRRRDLDADEAKLRAPFPFDRVAGPLIGWLQEWEETDQLIPERIATDRERRQRDQATLDRELTDQQTKLSDLRDALERQIEDIFRLISHRYDQLDRRYGGFGARLKARSIRPSGTDDAWVWEVEPEWKRSPTGRYVSYRRQMNDAQGKQHTIHLVLAALMATDNPAGRLLILDELGDKLDSENQRVLLEEIADVARTERVTILGTCQDWLLEQAAQIGAVGELIWFEYASKSDLLNRPTRMWAYDENHERVTLTADDILANRPL
jgi:hypothetical protein